MSTSRLGPWEMGAVLGRGGMGVVYRAVHADDGREAALKRVDQGSAPVLAALRAEIAVLSRLRNPGVVRILDHGVADGQPWYAMDLVVGQSLQARLATDRPAPPEARTVGPDDLADTPDGPAVDQRPERIADRLAAVGAVLQPVGWLHGEGVVHGDLKPPNVMLQGRRAVVLDFGLATSAAVATREALGAVRPWAGSIPYLAPERIRGEPPDPRTDLYAVGCMLHEAVTGRPPFVGTEQEVVNQHLLQSPVPVRSDHAELDALVAGLLAKDPRDRPAYAEEVAAVLARLGVPGVTPTLGARPWLHRPPLAGRADAIAFLVRTDAPLAWVTGPAGIGRTRLLAELAGRLSHGTARVEVFTAVPGGPPLPALARAARRGSADLYEPLYLAAVDELRARGVAVLLVDDMHHADALTMGFLGWLVDARPPGLRAIVSAADGAGDAVVARLVRSPRIPGVALVPLAEPEVAEVAAGMLGAPRGAGSPVADAVARAVAGHPRRLVESLRLSLDEGTLVRDGLAWHCPPGSALPETPEDLVARRIAQLGDHARVLRAAAVLGPEVDADALVAAGFPDDAVSAALAEGMRTGVVDGGRTFTSEPLRGALAAAVPADERAALHRSRVTALEGGPLTRALAEHAREAGDPRARAWLFDAMPSAAGPLEALALYDRAVAIPGPEDDAAIAGHHQAYDHRMYLRDLGGAAVVAARRFLVARSRVEEGEALRSMGRVLAAATRRDEARAVFLDALARADGDRTLIGRCHASIAQLEAELRRSASAEAHAALALAHLDPERDAGGRYGAYLALGQAALNEYRIDESAAHYADAAAAARLTGDPRLVATAVANLGVTQFEAGRDEEAAAAHREAIRAYRQVGDPMREAVSLTNLAMVYGRLGRVDEATALLDEAAAMHDRRGDAARAAVVRIRRCRVLRQAGRAPPLDGILPDLAVLERVGEPSQNVESLLEAARSAHHHGADPHGFLAEATRWADGNGELLRGMIDRVRAEVGAAR